MISSKLLNLVKDALINIFHEQNKCLCVVIRKSKRMMIIVAHVLSESSSQTDVSMTELSFSGDTVMITHEGWCWTADGLVITLHPMINGTQTPELLSARHRSV